MKVQRKIHFPNTPSPLRETRLRLNIHLSAEEYKKLLLFSFASFLPKIGKQLQFYGSSQKLHLYSMKFSLLFGFFSITAFTASSQITIHDFPIHKIAPPVYHHEIVSSPPYIDSALFSNYLNWQFQKDSLPEPYKGGKPFSISIFYLISREGKISEVKLFHNREEQEDLFEFVRDKLLACPYQFSPAYQNGRPIKEYLRMRIVK